MSREVTRHAEEPARYPMEPVRRSISVLVDNEAGVLSEISRLFSRKGYNIESL